MLVSSFPFLSTTVACRTTWLVPVRNVGISSGAAAGGGFCAAKTQLKKRLETRIEGLLRRRIISRAEGRFELRQAGGFHQLHHHAPVFAVAVFILGRITDDILVPQLDADFSCDIRQFRQVIHREMPPAGLL